MVSTALVFVACTPSMPVFATLMLVVKDIFDAVQNSDTHLFTATEKVLALSDDMN